jgi:hypothetical protein
MALAKQGGSHGWVPAGDLVEGGADRAALCKDPSASPLSSSSFFQEIRRSFVAQKPG